MVTVYRFGIYDGAMDCTRTSRRMGTREGIARIGGIMLDEPGVEVDEADVGEEEPGLTARDFKPRPWLGGFQTKVEL